MNFESIIIAVVSSGAITAVVTWFQNRRINNATARATSYSSESDYAEKIIAQADKRVEQMMEDRKRALQERDEAYKEAKVQRKDKHEWRQKFFDCQAEKHELELKLKDVDAQLAEERWRRCDVDDCPQRRPPRKMRPEHECAAEKDKQKQNNE